MISKRYLKPFLSVLFLHKAFINCLIAVKISMLAHVCEILHAFPQGKEIELRDIYKQGLISSSDRSTHCCATEVCIGL